jgi:hypothetical protein
VSGFAVYGVRLRGDTETRYIGQTGNPLSVRFAGLKSCETGHRSASLFGQWLHENDVEIFRIAECPDRASAKATEAVAIAISLRFNHRLFNRDHVPKHLRICSDFVPYETPSMREWRANFERSRQKEIAA